MQLYGAYFEYDGRASENYDLMIANVETERNTLLTSSSTTVTVNNKRNNKLHYVGRTYDEGMLSFDVEILSDTPLLPNVQEEVEKWLFLADGYKKLYLSEWCEDPMYKPSLFFVSGEGEKRAYLNCIFVNPEKIEYNGGVVGYKCTLECDSNCAWTDEISKTFTVPGSGSYYSATINTLSDMPIYIYPKIDFTTGSSGGEITFLNYTDSETRKTTFINLPAATGFHMDGEVNRIAPTAGTASYYSNFYNRNFVRLLRGENELRVYGDVARFTVTWKGRKYV